jgi:hypothetical protein
MIFLGWQSFAKAVTFAGNTACKGRTMPSETERIVNQVMDRHEFKTQPVDLKASFYQDRRGIFEPQKEFPFARNYKMEASREGA